MPLHLGHGKLHDHVSLFERVLEHFDASRIELVLDPVLAHRLHLPSETDEAAVERVGVARPLDKVRRGVIEFGELLRRRSALRASVGRSVSIVNIPANALPFFLHRLPFLFPLPGCRARVYEDRISSLSRCSSSSQPGQIPKNSRRRPRRRYSVSSPAPLNEGNSERP